MHELRCIYQIRYWTITASIEGLCDIYFGKYAIGPGLWIARWPSLAPLELEGSHQVIWNQYCFVLPS